VDNRYLLDLINEANTRGGGMVLNYEDKPAVVVLTIERYNNIVNNQAELTQDKVENVTSQNLQKGKVLVTGGAGYIGGHLVYELILAGYHVVILDNLSTGKKENLHPKAIFIEGDLADVNLLKDIFATHKFEAVFHMAASLEVEESVKEPAKYLENNVANTIKLLNAMAEANMKKIIFSSTAAVYGLSPQNPITETSPLHPNNPYGSSKLLAERAIKYFCENLGFKAVVFRYFNACGFNLDAKILPTHQSHLIYNVLQVAKGSRPFLEVYGNDYETFDGTCIRDYVHVTDIALPHILALESLDKASKFEVYNIGTGKGYSVAQVVNCASEVLNKIIPMEVATRRPGDAPSTVADNTKLLKNLGYELKHSSLENMISTSWEEIKDI
jgi:UDP-glucose 4-epimerase